MEKYFVLGKMSRKLLRVVFSITTNRSSKIGVRLLFVEVGLQKLLDCDSSCVILAEYGSIDTGFGIG